MSLLIILFFIALWAAFLFYIGSFLTRPLQKNKTIRKAAIFIFICVCFTLPILDEIKGAREFEELCAVGNVYQIAPWARGKKFDLKMDASPYKRLIGSARPVDERTITYTDKNTGEVIATSKAYAAYGGWLVQKMGFSLSTVSGPLIGRDQCIFSASQEARIREVTNTVSK